MKFLRKILINKKVLNKENIKKETNLFHPVGYIFKSYSQMVSSILKLFSDGFKSSKVFNSYTQMVSSIQIYTYIVSSISI